MWRSVMAIAMLVFVFAVSDLGFDETVSVVDSFLIYGVAWIMIDIVSKEE